MKVLEISTISLLRNGISTFITSTFNYLKTKGYDVSILVPEYADPNLLKEVDAVNHCFVIKNRNRNPILYFFKIVHIIKANKFDIVHVHGNSCTMAIELLAAKIAGCKIRIAHSHNTTCEHPLLNNILRFVFDFSCTERIACSEEAGRWLYKEKNFMVLKNGIDLNKYVFSNEIRKKFRNFYCISENDIILGNIAFFNYQKNQEYLIDVLFNLLKKNPNYKLLLIGDGDLKENVQDKVAKYALSDNVIILNSTNNVQDYMQVIDIFVLPSRFEGFPYVLVEAQASGLNCVVSSVVDRNVNITGNVVFASIKNIDEWVCKISEIEILHKDRYSQSFLARKCLSKQGFDLHISLSILEKKYSELYSRYYL